MEERAAARRRGARACRAGRDRGTPRRASSRRRGGGAAGLRVGRGRPARDAPRMTDFETRVGGEPIVPVDGWRLDWVEPAHGVARLTDGQHSLLVLVEGQGTDWTVTLRGRRVPVTVRSWRERGVARAQTEGPPPPPP